MPSYTKSMQMAKILNWRKTKKKKKKARKIKIFLLSFVRNFVKRLLYKVFHNQMYCVCLCKHVVASYWWHCWSWLLQVQLLLVTATQWHFKVVLYIATQKKRRKKWRKNLLKYPQGIINNNQIIMKLLGTCHAAVMHQYFFIFFFLPQKI